MSLKTKALLYNFLCFAVIFLTARFTLGYVIPLSNIALAVISAVLATVLAPKFGVVQTNSGYKLMMKWIFLKKVREIK
ncbi:hypothetical protein GWK08_12140 [Leptobacterium flavescens]|uniref:Uncharacterized protein n=1 Tax=Leptobacterium flavescens TaxID=472055 RepID=A0A6P0ULS9_9FLAO|nr:hypothetical protein [Leptobacterium flavescens]NER14195.1 hypothetical protein [Leptobacterium flavescens]